MIRLLGGVLVAGLVIGCDTEEPNPGGVLSLDRNRGEAPAGVTIQDVDIIKDGFIDIKDLFAVVHFYEQEVPEADEGDVVAAAPDTDDESDPCRDIQDGIKFPKVEVVDDNTAFKKIFDASDGSKYVYALVALSAQVGEYPLCIGMRFMLNNKLLPKEVKIKQIAGYETIFTEPITISLPHLRENKATAGAFTKHRISSKEKYGSEFFIASEFNFNPEYWGEQAKKKSQRGIPIGSEQVIFSIELIIETQETPLRYIWRIATYDSGEVPFHRHGGVSSNRDLGIYVNISPTEVRQRYFPEDL